MIVASLFEKESGARPSDTGRDGFFSWYRGLISRCIQMRCKGHNTPQLLEAMKHSWALHNIWLSQVQVNRLQLDAIAILEGMRIKAVIQHHAKLAAETMGTGTCPPPCVFAQRDGDLVSYLFADGTVEEWRFTELTGWYQHPSTRRDNSKR
jgi:hypothetical protein